jgi:hypothetical protein
VQVLVEHGTEVRTGDDLVIIEAMKVRQPEALGCQLPDLRWDSRCAVLCVLSLTEEQM